MNTVHILKEARALIADEKNWTRCTMATDIQGNDISPNDSGAFCFCSLGAIKRASGSRGYSSSEMSAREILRAELNGGHSIPSFNDTHTHAEVLDLFDRAIARAESEAA